MYAVKSVKSFLYSAPVHVIAKIHLPQVFTHLIPLSTPQTSQSNSIVYAFQLLKRESFHLFFSL